MNSHADIGKILWEQVEKENGVDFVFKIADADGEIIEEMGVHSIVLTSQSNVFNTMLTGSLKQGSPVTIMDTKPEIFRKFIGLMYGQPATVYSAEEAQDLFYLGNKYDYPYANEIAQKYLLANIDFNNISTVYSCATLFADKELQKANWDFLEKTIINTLKTLDCIEEVPKMDETKLEIKSNQTSKDLKEKLETHLGNLRNEQDVNKKVSHTIALIQMLLEECKKAFRIIVPNELVDLVVKIQTRTRGG